MMTTNIRGNADHDLEAVAHALSGFEADHPLAQIDLYRQNSISIRIRVIDPDFAGRRKSDRHSLVWKHLETLPESIQSDISMVVLLSPDEVRGSIANLEFEEPSPSLIK